MAHFLGTVQGSRGEASRLGGKNGGLRTCAASWQGSARCYLYEEDGVDKVKITLEPWQNKGEFKIIYDGPVGKFQPAT